jgi:GAF domain-containing protein
VGTGIAGIVAKTGKPLLINGAADRERYAADFERKDLVSSICAPLFIGKEILGVLSINSKNPKREFGENDLLYVKKLADFTADIIKTSKEYEHTTASTFSLSLLDNARDIITLKYSMSERLNLLLLKMVNAFHGEICNYYEYLRDKKVFLAKASSSFNIKLIKGKRLKLNDYFSKQVAVTEDTVFQSVPEKDGYNKKWYFATPVKVNGEMHGLLFLHLVSSRDTMKEEIGLLERIAEMIGAELAKHQEMESIRGQSIKFSAISEVSFDLAAARTLSDLSTIIVSNACMIMEAESSILRMYNQRSGTLDVLDSFSLKSFEFLKKLEVLDGVISNDAVTVRKTALIRDLEKSPYASRDTDTRSVLCMYLERNDRILGTLSLYDKKSIDLYTTRSFSPKDKEIFLNFCLQASKALDRFMISDIP